MIPFMKEKLRLREGLWGAPDHTSGRIAGLVMPGAEVCWESHPPTHQEMKSTHPSLNLPGDTDSNDEPLGLGCVCLCTRVFVFSHLSHAQTTGGHTSLS